MFSVLSAFALTAKSADDGSFGAIAAFMTLLAWLIVFSSNDGFLVLGTPGTLIGTKPLTGIPAPFFIICILPPKSPAALLCAAS